jgi:hypothetical protein
MRMSFPTKIMFFSKLGLKCKVEERKRKKDRKAERKKDRKTEKQKNKNT